MKTYINLTSPSIDRQVVFSGSATEAGRFLCDNHIRLNETDAAGKRYYANGPVVMPAGRERSKR